MALIILPVMFGGLILTGLQQINEGPLAENQQQAQIEIDKEGRYINLGIDRQGDEVESQYLIDEQFREIVIYSQMSAVNCEMFYWLHGEAEEGGGPAHYLDDNNLPGLIQDSDTYMLKYVIPGRNKGQSHRLFNYLNQSQYVPTCIGTSNEVPASVVDRGNRALTKGPLGPLRFAGHKILGGLHDFWNAVDCKQEPSWASDRGNDMEGRYGAIEFKAHQTIYPGRGSNGKIWAINTLPGDTGCISDVEFYGPAFFEAGDWMDYLPQPEDKDTQEDIFNEDDHTETVEVDNPRGGTTTTTRTISWSDRVEDVYGEHPTSDALIDAPAITDQDISEVNGGDGVWPKRDVYYVICEGASGRIRTNANLISNEGEAIWGENNKGVGEYKGEETRTFTFIDVTANKTSCLDNIDYGGEVDVTGNLNGNEGPSCSTFEDATQDPVKTGVNDFSNEQYECNLVRYSWNHGSGDVAGTKTRDIYMIGWVED